MSVILYGGSFDPLHNGHINLAMSAREKTHADMVFFIPCKDNWLKDRELSDNRLEMILLALKKYPFFQVSDYDLVREGPSYSVDTCIYFHKQYPDQKLYFLIGSDQLSRVRNWKRYDELVSLITFLVYPRNGYPIEESFREDEHFEFLDGIRIDMSSTLFREGKKLDAPEEIIRYVLDHDLYFLPEIRGMMKKHRYNHSKSVAITAYEIAKHYHADEIKALQAGLFHDCGKDIPDDVARNIVKNYFPEYAEVPEFALHQFTGAYLAKTKFGIEDEEVLQAISSHCTGRARMSDLEKIVYIADKVEPTREFETKTAYEHAMISLDEGMKEVLVEQDQYLLKRNLERSHYSLCEECYQYYVIGEDKNA